jgi:hypothetical protein
MKSGRQAMNNKGIRLVDIEEFEESLGGDVDPDLVEEYYRFGALLLSEVQAAGSQIDGRLVTALGLAVGLLVSLLFGTALARFAIAKIWITLAAAFALLGVVLAAYGSMARMWRLPSEQDWFREGLRDANDLKKYHIVSLLAAHQQHVKLAALKGDCLRWAQGCIVIGALLVTVSLSIAAFS